MSEPKLLLAQLLNRKDLSAAQMSDLMRSMMRGEVENEMIAALLIALSMKGESVDEISAAAKVMREFASAVQVADNENLVDVVGTGGDNAHTFNISSAAMFVAAGAGAKVAKHGGRSVSSSSGSADIIEAMGASLHLSAANVATCIQNAGVGFMFAPNHHPSMKHVAPTRKALGVRTLFNILGPLTNPAGAQRQLLGVWRRDLLLPMARVLQQLGSRHVLVVTGCDGLDEITLTGETYVVELKNNNIEEYTVSPATFGLSSAGSLESLRVKNSAESLQMIEHVLNGQTGPARNIVVANAAAVLYVAGCAGSLFEGAKMAENAIDSGQAKNCQQQFVRLTKHLTQ